MSDIVYTYGGSNVTTSDGSVESAAQHAFIGDTSISGSATITSVSYSTSVTIGDVIASEDIPYMRTREVQFTCKGLKPSTQMYPFFDNTDVSAYCKQDGGSYGGAMTTSNRGVLSGTFNIPNTDIVRFRAGTKRFTLNDNTLNAKETSLSYADADYSATGKLETRNQFITTTASVSTVTIPWDPLAQSFFVEKDSGVFLTSIDLFFSTKDKATNITLQIRNMDNGSPGTDVFPYSTVTLSPDEVNVSTDATAATKFTFPSPVYLANGAGYCFVVMSNSNNYNVWIATMGNKEIASEAYISKQPYIGVLFKSQNNITWTADQSSDMKFNINIAKFETNTVRRGVFNNKIAVARNLLPNPLTSTSGSKVISVKMINHGLFVGSKVTISGIDVAPTIPLAELNALQTVTTVIDADNFQFSVPTTNASSTGSFGGNKVLADGNTLFDTVYPNFQELLFENTKAGWTIDGTTGKSLSGTETPYSIVPTSTIVPNKTSDLPYPFMVPSASEAYKLSRYALGINVDFSSTYDNISPVVDINRIGVIGVNNIINKPTTLNETAATGGNAIDRYITKIVGLKNPATSLRLYIDINKPQGAEVYVFFRTGNSEEELNTKNWVLMPVVIAVTATDSVTFSEAQYSQDNIAGFGYYQFKIVGTSASSSVIPRIQRLRGIALGT